MNNKRFLLKLSGEVLKGDQDFGLSMESVDQVCERLVPVIKKGIQLGFVVGGGNILRGASSALQGYDRCFGDQMGMMATVINGLALVERFRSKGINALLQSGIKVEGVVDLFHRDKAVDVLNNGGVVVFCGGTGNPFFSTDTTAVLRALQINASYVFKATKVDGIYDKDPAQFKDAKLYQKMTFDEMIDQNIGVMDMTSVILMQKNQLKLRVFNMTTPDILEKACFGKDVGTSVES